MNPSTDLFPPLICKVGKKEMSVVDFKSAKEQKKSVVTRFEYASSYLELSTSRMRALSDYISKIKTEYSKHHSTMPNLNLENFKKYTPEANKGKFLAPGLPGCHTDRLALLGSMSKQVSEEFGSFSKFIDTAILTPLLDFKTNSEGKLSTIMDGYRKRKNYRKDCKAEVKKSLKDFNNATVAAEKAYSEFTNLQKSNKVDKLQKATNTLTECCKNYQKTAAQLRINIGMFNTAHANFIKYCEDSIERMNELHPKRIQIAVSMVQDSLRPSIETFANSYKDVQNWFEQSAVAWEPHFHAYVNFTGIVRTMIKPQDFITHDGVCYPARILQLDAPIFIATVTKNFSSDEHFKMSITAGQKLGIYEGLNQDWVLARDLYGQKRYVPSSCLTIEHSQLALVRASQIGNSNGSLPVSSGDLLYIIEEKEHDFLCMNLKGEKGTVPKYAVFVEQQ